MNKVFIATSLDGYIADKEGQIDWLHSIPNPENDDMGYNKFISTVDALIMGRTTFETVLSFGIDWPYEIPVFVLSTTLKAIPEELQEKVELTKGSPKEILEMIHSKGFDELYIDGGTTIQGFLSQDLIDQLIITTIPVLLGGGSPLFGTFDQRLSFQHVRSSRYLDCIVQNEYLRKKNES
ncbi:MAG: dihydrofolate reductase family protein [Saprospiraceae bacterium]|nr:dihydrofolate reductase family protein [Saprospiraceae bacterium]